MYLFSGTALNVTYLSCRNYIVFAGKGFRLVPSDRSYIRRLDFGVVMQMMAGDQQARLSGLRPDYESQTFRVKHPDPRVCYTNQHFEKGCGVFRDCSSGAQSRVIVMVLVDSKLWKGVCVKSAINLTTDRNSRSKP